MRSWKKRESKIPIISSDFLKNIQEQARQSIERADEVKEREWNKIHSFFVIKLVGNCHIIFRNCHIFNEGEKLYNNKK